MLGIDQFLPAYIFLGIALILCCAKLAHSSISADPRHPIALAIGCLLLITAAAVIGLWTRKMSVRSDEDAKKLEPLSHIQELQTQVEEIPALQKQIKI